MIQKQHYTNIVLNINDIWNIYIANFGHQPKVENRYSEKTRATRVSLRSKPISREFVSIENAHRLATQATNVSLEIYESGFGWNWVIEKFRVQKVAICLRALNKPWRIIIERIFCLKTPFLARARLLTAISEFKSWVFASSLTRIMTSDRASCDLWLPSVYVGI